MTSLGETVGSLPLEDFAALQDHLLQEVYHHPVKNTRIACANLDNPAEWSTFRRAGASPACRRHRKRQVAIVTKTFSS
jgi:hypothetical protein